MQRYWILEITYASLEEKSLENESENWLVECSLLLYLIQFFHIVILIEKLTFTSFSSVIFTTIQKISHKN